MAVTGLQCTAPGPLASRSHPQIDLPSFINLHHASAPSYAVEDAKVFLRHSTVLPLPSLPQKYTVTPKNIHSSMKTRYASYLIKDIKVREKHLSCSKVSLGFPSTALG